MASHLGDKVECVVCLLFNVRVDRMAEQFTNTFEEMLFLLLSLNFVFVIDVGIEVLQVQICTRFYCWQIQMSRSDTTLPKS